VRNVGHEQRAHFVGDFAKTFPVELTRVGGRADHEQFGFVFEGQTFGFGVVDQFGFFVDAEGHHFEIFSGEIHRMPVREVSAVREAQTHDGVARLNRRQINRHVGGAAGMRLNIGMFGSKNLFGAFDREGFHDVDFFTTAVIPFAGVTFGIFVGEDAALRFENGFGDHVFGGDEFNGVRLAFGFSLNGFINGGILFFQNAFHAMVPFNLGSTSKR